jgi:hypothetical protein
MELNHEFTMHRELALRIGNETHARDAERGCGKCEERCGTHATRIGGAGDRGGDGGRHAPDHDGAARLLMEPDEATSNARP